MIINNIINNKVSILFDDIVHFSQRLVLMPLVPPVHHHTAEAEHQHHEPSQYHRGLRTAVQLPPESHYLHWVVVHYLSRFAIDCLHSHILDIFADFLSEGDLVAGSTLADGLGFGRLQLLHLRQAEHYRRTH